MLNNSLNFESLRILHHMVFTLAMKYFRYQGQHSDVINHVTMPENNIFAHCANRSIEVDRARLKNIIYENVN